MTTRRPRPPRRNDRAGARRPTAATMLQRRQFDLAAEAARVWAWVWDVPTDRLEWMISPEELLGPRPAGGRYPDFRTLVHPDDLERYCAAGRSALALLGEGRTSAPYEVRFRVVRTDGAVRWVQARGRAEADERGRPRRMIGVTVDVHQQQEAGERRQLAESRLQRALDGATRRMGELVEALLALARVNRAELQRARIDLGALARHVVDEMGERARPAAVRIAPDMPPADADPQLVRQLLANLLENAIKYSARERAPEVEVGWSGERHAWFVRDNGAGFDMAYGDKLFRPFERLHAPAEFPGTGIGLAIVKRVAERHGGRVWAEGAPGAGACFWFTLGG